MHLQICGWVISEVLPEVVTRPKRVPAINRTRTMMNVYLMVMLQGIRLTDLKTKRERF